MKKKNSDNLNIPKSFLELIKEDAQGLMLLDKELAARTTTVPTEFSKGIQAALKGTTAA